MDDDEVVWAAPLPGSWLRNFRLGEWLPAPITPLFETWLLERLETACFTGMVAAGHPRHVTVHGWYYHSPVGASGLRQRLGMLRRPLKLIANFGVVHWRPDLTERWTIAPARHRWQQSVLPRYQALVEQGTGRLDHADPAELIGIVDALAAAAGEYFASITQVAGFAWKTEWSLARFCRRHLGEIVGDNHQVLLVEPTTAATATPSHAVYSLDWIFPTFGETAAEDAPPASRRTRGARRDDLQTARQSLRGRHRRRLDTHVDVARRAARYREQQVADFTLAWPILRAAVLRLGTELVERRLLDGPPDVFFLTRDELEHAIAEPAGALQDKATDRRRQWEHQQRLSPPLVLGPTPATDRIVRHMQPSRRPSGSLVIVCGLAASPGTATGPVRIVRGPHQLDRVQPGDVVVTPLTTPAWTSALRIAAAIICEGGTLLAHASITARELGIPAVVAAEAATTTLQDGQIVTVDGATGAVISR